MIVTCPSCSTKFRVPDAALGAKGRFVRCSNCAHKWHQAPEGPKTSADSGAAAMAAEAVTSTRVRDTAPPAFADMAGGSAVATLLAPTLDAGMGPRPVASDGGSRVGWLVLLLVVLLLAFGLWFGRGQLVAIWPPAAKLYVTLGLTEASELPGAGLAVRNVAPRRLIEDGVSVIEIVGEIYNESDVERVLPALVATLRDDDGGLVKQWPVAVPVTILRSGVHVPFKTRVEQPSDAATSIVIMFADGAKAQ